LKTVLCRASLLLQLRRPLLLQAALALLVSFLAELSRTSLLLRNHLLLAVFGETFALLAILFLLPRVTILILLPLLVFLLLNLLLLLPVLILSLLIGGALLLLILLLLSSLFLLSISILLLLNLLLRILIALAGFGRGPWSVRVPRPLRLLRFRLW
jgi:hypothetical protein